MTEFLTDLVPGGPGDAPDDTGWQPLPRRARALFLLATVPFFVVPSTIAAWTLGEVLFADDGWRVGGRWEAAAIAFLVSAAVGAWIGLKQYRYTAWRLDAHGLAVRRGRFWQRETRVPATRVQHLDVKHGPLQRRRDLATLVVHTAGTAHGSVTVPNLDATDAERLRDRLGRQIEHDDA